MRLALRHERSGNLFIAHKPECSFIAKSYLAKHVEVDSFPKELENRAVVACRFCRPDGGQKRVPGR